MRIRYTLIATLALLPALAEAHAMLDHALPAVGSTVAASPAELKIWFDQPVDAAKSSVDVVDSAGKNVGGGTLHGDKGDDMLLVLPLAPAKGKLTVTWSAFSPACGHTTHGSFKFTVGP